MDKFKVQGNRLIDGQLIEGWLLQYKYNTSKYLIRTFEDKDDNYDDYVVDIKTVKHIKAEHEAYLYTRGLIDHAENARHGNERRLNEKFMDRVEHVVSVYEAYAVMGIFKKFELDEKDYNFRDIYKYNWICKNLLGSIQY